jgi:hypothetical protein
LVRPAPPGTREQDLQQARVVVREVADQAQDTRIDDTRIFLASPKGPL